MSTAILKSGPTNGRKALRTVVLSHPFGTDISIIRRVLEGEGVAVRLNEDGIEPGKPIRTSLLEGMQKADAVIAVLGNPPENVNVFYQIGLADGLGKPVLVVSTGGRELFSNEVQYPYLRARTDDEDALRFGLSHFLHAPLQKTTHERNNPGESKPLGDKVNGFLDRIRSETPMREDELVSIVASAIRESGVDAQASMLANDTDNGISVDIAVWSDELESLVGNPLPIDVKISLLTRDAAESAVRNLQRALIGAHARWGLILYQKATTDAMNVLVKHPVLAISIEDFLEGLRYRTFGRIVTDLRNQAVHGVRADA